MNILKYLISAMEIQFKPPFVYYMIIDKLVSELCIHGTASENYEMQHAFDIFDSNDRAFLDEYIKKNEYPPLRHSDKEILQILEEYAKNNPANAKEFTEITTLAELFQLRRLLKLYDCNCID